MTNTVLRAAAIVFLLMPLYLLGQKVVKDTSIVQFSGIVLDGSTDELYPVPYANIVVKDKYRGTYTDLKGFFSIVVQKGDIIVGLGDMPVKTREIYCMQFPHWKGAY